MFKEADTPFYIQRDYMFSFIWNVCEKLCNSYIHFTNIFHVYQNNLPFYKKNYSVDCILELLWNYLFSKKKANCAIITLEQHLKKNPK